MTEAKPDIKYYKRIPPNVTREQLTVKMAIGVLRYINHMGSENLDIPALLDRWFEHDANGTNSFDHLIPAEDFDSFTQDVIKLVENKQRF